jgi:hypothetical protein
MNIHADGLKGFSRVSLICSRNSSPAAIARDQSQPACVGDRCGQMAVRHRPTALDQWILNPAVSLLFFPWNLLQGKR